MTTTTGSSGRREPVLISADSVILHKGLTGTSIDDIIDRAAVTRGSVFHHFDVEPGLAEALMQRYPQQDERLLNVCSKRKVNSAKTRCRA